MVDILRRSGAIIYVKTQNPQTLLVSGSPARRISAFTTCVVTGNQQQHIWTGCQSVQPNADVRGQQWGGGCADCLPGKHARSGHGHWGECAHPGGPLRLVRAKGVGCAAASLRAARLARRDGRDCGVRGPAGSVCAGPGPVLPGDAGRGAVAGRAAAAGDAVEDGRGAAGAAHHRSPVQRRRRCATPADHARTRDIRHRTRQTP